MENLLFFLIVTFGIATYASGLYQMYRSEYKPSFFSRAIWFLLGINSFIGVILSNGSAASIILAGTLLIGNFLMFVVSYSKGSREFGIIEKISLGLLGFSGLIWLTYDLALLNLAIGLLAHFIGGIPTYGRVLKKPENEQAYHWYLFFLASVLGIIASPDKSISYILFPLYFALFDGSIIILANRNKIKTLF
ncbi:hypothetical protein HZB74_00215 [Candidatus Saccharibacteria bacterium]|nr:hypothetical protein [Candidatus Saccharibacteria bacterium]